MRKIATLGPALALVALALSGLPASGQEAEPTTKPPQIDILTVKPADLAGPDRDEIMREATTAYQDGRYEDAARLYIRALRLRGGDAFALYNLACCYGLLGHGEQAALFMRASWDAGFDDLNHIRRDPDFDAVRKSEPFREAMEVIAGQAEAKKRTAGKGLSVVSKVHADVRVLEPKVMDPMRRYPVLIGLHGYGSNGEDFATLFANRGIEPEFIYCVVQAPYAFNLGTKTGYSWMLRGPEVKRRDAFSSHHLSARLVLDVLDELRKEYPVDERNVFLMGFSQGAGMAFSIGMRHPDTFRGVIPVGGWLDRAEFSRDEVAKARKHVNFLICHSPADRVVPFDSAEKAVSFLTEEAVTHRLLRYEGGHTVPKDLVVKILDWMKKPEIAASRKVAPPKER